MSLTTPIGAQHMSRHSFAAWPGITKEKVSAPACSDGPKCMKMMTVLFGTATARLISTDLVLSQREIGGRFSELQSMRGIEACWN